MVKYIQRRHTYLYSCINVPVLMQNVFFIISCIILLYTSVTTSVWQISIASSPCYRNVLAEKKSTIICNLFSKHWLRFETYRLAQYTRHSRTTRLLHAYKGTAILLYNASYKS